MANEPEELQAHPVSIEEITIEELKRLSIEVTVHPKLSEAIMGRPPEDKHLAAISKLGYPYGEHERPGTYQFTFSEIFHKEGLKTVTRCIVVRLTKENLVPNSHEAWLEIKRILEESPPDALVLFNLEGAGEDWPLVQPSLEPYQAVLMSLCIGY